MTPQQRWYTNLAPEAKEAFLARGRERQRLWRQRPENRARMRANQARYYASEHGRLAVSARNRINKMVRMGPDRPEWQLVQELIQAPCAYCGGPGGTIDHIVPLARGGTNAPSNLAPSCLACNIKKGVG